MDDNVRVNRLKGVRRTKPVEDEPQPEQTEKVEEVNVEEHVEDHVEEEEHEEVEEEEPPPKPKAKKAKAPPKKPVEVEEYDVSSAPDIVIHKKHKGAKPRKLIIITGDSDIDASDEELPYRSKPKIEVKKRPASHPAGSGVPAKKPEPKPEPPKRTPAPPRKQNVGLVSNPKPVVVDAGKGLPQRYAMAQEQKKAYVVDEFIDSILGL